MMVKHEADDVFSYAQAARDLETEGAVPWFVRSLDNKVVEL